MAQVRLSEDMKRLMGIRPREFGGVPALFQKGEFCVGGKPKKVVQEAAPARLKRLEERKSLQLFRNYQEMIEALKRAHKLVSRVNATIQSNRGSTRGAMNEKSRADMYRLDQEMAAALDSINAACEAINDVRLNQKNAEEEARVRRQQGR